MRFASRSRSSPWATRRPTGTGSRRSSKRAAAHERERSPYMAEIRGTPSADAAVQKRELPGDKTSEPVLDEEGHFHATDEPVDLGHYPLEAWIAFVIFWVLAADIFY